MNDDSPESPLTFQWQDRQRPLGRLLLLLLLTIAGVVAMFFVFQVVYPHTRTFTTSPQQILMFEPTQAAGRQLVNRVRDEGFLFANPGSGVEASAEALADRLPVFRPSFAGFQMSLQSIPETQDAGTSPRLFSIHRVPLPQTPTVLRAQDAVPMPAPRRTPVLKAVVHGRLAARGLESPAELAGVSIQEPHAIRYAVGVSGSGTVTFALPLHPIPDRRLADSVRRAITNLRFKPALASPIQWGEVSLRWDNSDPAQ